MTQHPLKAYTREVLSFSLGPERPGTRAADPGPEISSEQAQNVARRLAESLARSGHGGLILLGLGSGRVALALDRLLPATARLIVCEPDPALARRVLSRADRAPLAGNGRTLVLADTSAWAMLLLLNLHGPGQGAALILDNPELTPEAKKGLRPLRRLLTQTRCEELATAHQTVPGPGPSLSFAAILRPGEPDLADFLARIPAQAQEVVLVWDSPDLPDPLPSISDMVPDMIPGLPQERVRHLARPLAGDFAAQRNAMLAACQGDWVLTLDGDERLCPRLAAQLPALLARTDVNGYCFQRRTLYPDPGRCKIGYGLWPDPQLRLFRRVPGLRYERPVHEVLTGLAPPLGLPLGGSILHFNHLARQSEDLERKLKLFDAASGGGVSHTLSVEYPSLALGLLDPASGPDRLLLLDQGI